MDSYLSPEMKSTGEAIGYDASMTRALYKALQASGMQVANTGTILATICDEDKEEALPLIKRFYNLGFDIEATSGTSKFLDSKGIRNRLRPKITDGSNEIPDAIRQGRINYIINTRSSGSDMNNDGHHIRRCATENNVTVFTSLDTAKALLDVLEDITMCVSTIDAE